MSSRNNHLMRSISFLYELRRRVYYFHVWNCYPYAFVCLMYYENSISDFQCIPIHADEYIYIILHCTYIVIHMHENVNICKLSNVYHVFREVNSWAKIVSCFHNIAFLQIAHSGGIFPDFSSHSSQGSRGVAPSHTRPIFIHFRRNNPPHPPQLPELIKNALKCP